MSTSYVILTIAAIVLMLAECFLPGGVAFALGFSILPVIALHYVGVITTVGGALGMWVTTSLVVTIAGQAAIRRMFPADRSTLQIDEDEDAFGQVVEVLADVGGDPGGRIRYQGTSWDAISLDRPLKVGDKAKLVAREGLAWVVEPIDDDGDGRPDRWEALASPDAPPKS